MTEQSYIRGKFLNDEIDSDERYLAVEKKKRSLIQLV